MSNCTYPNSLIAAQSVAIAAFVISIPALFLTWFLLPFYPINIGISYEILPPVVLVINIVGLVLFQIPWCCRQGRCFLFTAGCFAVFLSLSTLIITIFAAVECSIYFSVEGWIAFAFGLVGAILWTVAASLMFVFVWSDRQTELEQERNNYLQASRMVSSRHHSIDIGGRSGNSSSDREIERGGKDHDDLESSRK